MIPIPAIDLKGGRCVRLLKGEMDKETVYGQDPVAMAKQWEAEGARRLHVVDLEGAVKGRPVHAPIICDIAKAISIPVEVGGGIRTLSDMETYLSAGIHTVIVGTSAFLKPGFLEQAAKEFPNRFAIALDTRGSHIVVKGWLASTTEEIEPWMERLNQLPLFAIIHTDVGRDGTQQGPNTSALRFVLERSTRPVIASGGVGKLNDLTGLRKIEAELEKPFMGIIIGRALYEQKFTLQEATRLLEAPTC